MKVGSKVNSEDKKIYFKDCMQLASATNSKDPSEEPLYVLDFKNDMELKIKIEKEVLLSFYKSKCQSNLIPHLKIW